MKTQITAEWLGAPETGTPEWHENRKGVTGTKISCIMGANPYKSAYTLWAEETGQITDTFEGNDATEFGSAVEGVIGEMFMKRHPEFTEVITAPGQYAHETTRSFRASPDALLNGREYGRGVLEIKFTSQYWEQPPAHYIQQVQWYLFVLGLDYGFIAAYTARGYKDWLIQADKTLHVEMAAAANAWLLCCEMQIEPLWDGSKSTYETVRELSPGLTDEQVELGQLYVDLYAAKAIADKAEEIYRAKQSEVLAYLNGAKYGLYKGDTKIVLQARNGKPFITFK
jgi:putative phage-type endonuclease